MNPGSPTPQAGILIQNRTKFPKTLGKSTGLSMLDDDPAYAEYNAKVLKTIQEIRDKGKAKRTIKSVFSTCGDLTEKPI